MTNQPRDTRPKRPLAITLVGLLAVLAAAASIAHGLFELWLAGMLSTAQPPPPLLDPRWSELWRPLARGVVDIGVGLVLLIIGISLLRLRRWSWVALMVWTTIGLAIGLVRYYLDQPNYVAMAFNVLVVLALNQRDVQSVFGIRHLDTGDLDEPSRNPIDSF